MLGINRKREAVEKAPPLGRRSDEQGIHRRHQPNHTEVIGESCGRSSRFAIDPVFALDASVVGGGALNSGAERGKPEPALDFGGNGPGAVALVESDLLDRGAAKTVARREE